MKRALLLLACSQRKRPDADLLPAWERYDGGAYRVMRNLRRRGVWPFTVDVYILSARFGLIPAEQPIPDYDQRMTRTRARELRPQVLQALEKLLATGQYDTFYLDLGQDYLPAVEGWEHLARKYGVAYQQARERIGQRLRALRQWLLERWRGEAIVPFFVADRPKSLDILAGLPLQDYAPVRIGIMAHANTTPRFQTMFHDYPCHRPQACPVLGGRPCPYGDQREACPHRAYILRHTIKMSDSGVFTREGGRLTYTQLFERYTQMGVQYGIILDVFRDARGTVESAREALKVYQAGQYPFQLVGVAQGKTVEEYLWSYTELRAMGYTHIAIGGLLRKVENSARYTQVDNEAFMEAVLTRVRETFPEDWLFALGCLHPKRLPLFQRLNVWGDYKGWIFQYEKPEVWLRRWARSLRHAPHVPLDGWHEALDAWLKAEEVVRQKQRVLVQAKRDMRALLRAIYQALLTVAPEKAAELYPYLNRALLKPGERRRFQAALRQVDIPEGIHRFQSLEAQVTQSRAAMLRAQRILQQVQETLAQQITLFLQRNAHTLPTPWHARLREGLDWLTDSPKVAREAQTRWHIQQHFLRPLRHPSFTPALSADCESPAPPRQTHPH